MAEEGIWNPVLSLEGNVHSRVPVVGKAEDVTCSAQDTVQSAWPCCSGGVS